MTETVVIPAEASPQEKPHANERQAGRVPELDGIRGLAIGMVLLWHYFILPADPAPGSAISHALALGRLTWTGVDLFFVLSGFLIGGILLDARKASNYFSVFYRRRFFRILPIYVVLLLAFSLLDHTVSGAHRDQFAWLLKDHLPLYSYWTFTQNFWPLRATVFGANTLAITWSLAIEEQFYLTLPLLVRILSSRLLVYCVVAGIVLAPVSRLFLLVATSFNWVPAFSLMPCRADALLLGVLAAILLRDAQWRARIERAGRFFAIALPALFLGAVFLGWKSPDLTSPLMQEVGLTWVAAFYAVLLLFAVTRPQSLLSRALRLRWLGWLGAIAYGVYLFHQTIQGLLYALLWRGEPRITGALTLLTSLASLALTLLVARLSWRFFEKPLIRFGHLSRYNESPLQGSKV